MRRLRPPPFMGEDETKTASFFSSPVYGGSGRVALEGGERSDDEAIPLHHFVVPLTPQAGAENCVHLSPPLGPAPILRSSDLAAGRF
jgi:hypothetical protein